MSVLGRFDVIIAGAGATGLWIASCLAEAGARVLVVHAPHGQGYSSTRNQGWLHSGALYAVFGAPAVTRECIQGSARIRAHAARHDPALLADGEFCYVFGSPQEADAAAAACLEAGIAGRRRGASPGLQCLLGRPAWPVLVPDASVDSTRLLRTLASQLLASGVSVAVTRSLRDIRLRLDNGTWDAGDGGFSASAPSVVLAAGTLIPDLLASAATANGLTAHLPFEVTRTTVLAVPRLGLPAGVVCVGGGPHVIPYRTAQAAGVTICVPFDNQPASPGEVHRPPDAADRDRVLSNVRAFTPGLAAMLAGRDGTFWYSCQKLIPAGAASRPGWRRNVFAPAAPGLYVAYAGKFTTAPVLAEHATRQLGYGQSAGPPPGAGTLQIADQPFRTGNQGRAPAAHAR